MGKLMEGVQYFETPSDESILVILSLTVEHQPEATGLEQCVEHCREEKRRRSCSFSVSFFGKLGRRASSKRRRLRWMECSIMFLLYEQVSYQNYERV
jgi:hypothetical protein